MRPMAFWGRVLAISFLHTAVGSFLLVPQRWSDAVTHLGQWGWCPG